MSHQKLISARIITRLGQPFLDFYMFCVRFLISDFGLIFESHKPPAQNSVVVFNYLLCC